MQNAHRLITPTQLALFSRSPVIGAWWEELDARKLFHDSRPEGSSLDELLQEQGHEHEEVLLDALELAHQDVYRQIPFNKGGPPVQHDYDATKAAMRRGHQYIHQAALHNDELRGWVDLLERIDRPSNLGGWSYIPIECKLSSHPRPIYLVQACAYCELLEPILGHRPEQFRLHLGGGAGQDTYPSERFWNWYEHLRRRYRQFIAGFDQQQCPEHAPGDHGRWDGWIEQQLQQQRDLMLVAGMRQSQRSKLRSAGIATIDELAKWPADQKVPDLDDATLLRLREQASIQLKSEASPGKPPRFEVRPAEQQARGLSLLPRPDPGDVWFDMEGYPNPINGEQLEYLFGACYRDINGEVAFQPWWAHDRAQEKQAFSDFINWVEERRLRHPGLHVYHYASYEKTALSNLASRHQIHQARIDEWRREQLLVDLYPIVRNGLLIGAPSYSIKKVELLYSPPRQEAIDSAADSVVLYAQWRKSGEPHAPGRSAGGSPLLMDLEDYNRRDCEVTEGLHGFLLKRLLERPELAALCNWSATDPAAAATPTLFVRDLEVAARQLLNELETTDAEPEAIGPWGISRHLQKLLAQLIDFPEREAKVEWWEFFNRLQLPPDEREADGEVIAAAGLHGQPQSLPRKMQEYHYRFDPAQPLKLGAGLKGSASFVLQELVTTSDGRLAAGQVLMKGERPLEVTGYFDATDPALVKVRVSETNLDQINAVGWASGLPARADLIALPANVISRCRSHLERISRRWVDDKQPLPPPVLHLLVRRSVPQLPELNAVISNEPRRSAELLGELLGDADGVALSLQGPPGTGKTTVTAELIARLVIKGQRVAVSSNSNAAITNLLRRVAIQLEASGSKARVVKASSSTSEKADIAALSGTRAEVLKDPGEPEVLGGTVFTFVKEAYDDTCFDLLVVDEAGQVSLSNLLYMGRVARNILLVGDQQQLSQPNRAHHPDDSGLSAIDYMMEGHAVVPPARGVFLTTSWRMPPPLTAVVSELFYENKLQSAAENSANRVLWSRRQQGLLFDPVEHRGNGSRSEEEVERIAVLVQELIGCRYQRTAVINGERQLLEGAISSEDILITAPYNLQVNRLRRRLGSGFQVGSVDRFQGQEAVVAICSLTASDGDAAPRGLSFVLDPSRLNVAISRAQCLSIVVGSPALACGISRSINEVHQLSRLCRLMDLQNTNL